METMGAVNLKPDKARKPNGKAWWIVLGVLLAVIIALVVAVVVVNVNTNGDEGEVNSDVQDMSESIETDDIDETIALYQSYIDRYNGGRRAAFLQERLEYILENDTNKLYGEFAIADAVGIDEIMKTVDSAGQVYNVSMYYEDEEVSSEYIEIISERQAESGEEDYTDGEG